MDKDAKSNSPSEKAPTGFVSPSPRGGNKKTIIILAFLVTFVGLAAYFGPLMVSSSALAMAAIDVVSQDNAAAMEHLKLAIQMNPKSAMAYQYRGYLFANLVQPERALADFTQAIEYGAGGESNYGRAVQYHMLGRMQPALNDYQVSIDKNPTSKAAACVNRADIYYRLDDTAHSLAECNKAIAEQPKNCTALLNRATCYVRMHRYQAAIDDLSLAMDHVYGQDAGPNAKRDIFMVRAAAYRGLKKNEEAESDLADALRAANPRHKNISEAKFLEPDFHQREQRKHFILFANLSQKEAASSADRLESFITYVDKNICHVRQDRNFRIFCFPNEQAYKDYADKRKLFPDLGDEAKTAKENLVLGKSRYNANRDAIFTYALPDLSGTVGSVMEKIIEDMPFPDKWAGYGFGALFAKTYGYATPGECQLFLADDPVCYAQPTMTTPTLMETVNNNRRPTDNAAARLAALFLIKQGKFERYMRLCRSGEQGDYATMFEAAFNKRMPQIEPEWNSFLKTMAPPSNSPAAKAPDSAILATKAEFDKLSAANPELKLIPVPTGAPEVVQKSSEKSTEKSTEK